MINLILSLIIGALSWVACAFIFDSVWSGLLPFLILTPVAMVVLNRQTAKKVNAIMGRIQPMMMNLQKLPSEAARKHQLTKIADVIKEAYAYSNYQFFLKQQLNSQLGTLYYMQKNFKEAEPYLKDSFIQPGTARAMYACILYKRKETNAMIAQFELSVKLDKRTPLLWNLYAWCLNELKERDKAIAVLNRGLTNNPQDKITQDNLDLIKNSGKINMRPFEMMWYQFLLEDPPQQVIRMLANSKGQMFRK